MHLQGATVYDTDSHLHGKLGLPADVLATGYAKNPAGMLAATLRPHAAHCGVGLLVEGNPRGCPMACSWASRSLNTQTLAGIGHVHVTHVDLGRHC